MLHGKIKLSQRASPAGTGALAQDAAWLAHFLQEIGLTAGSAGRSVHDGIFAIVKAQGGPDGDAAQCHPADRWLAAGWSSHRPP
jgi:hypothetical protein